MRILSLSRCSLLISLFAFAGVAGAWQPLPSEFSSVLGKRKIEFEQVAPHLSKFREYKAQYTSTPRGSEYRNGWSEIDPRTALPPGMDSVQRECWFALASGATTCSLRQMQKIRAQIKSPGFMERTDLLLASRAWVNQVGMRRTRDLMIDALKLEDSDSGFFEKRSIAVRHNQSLQFSDSIMSIPKNQRARFGIFFAYGYTHDQGMPSKILRRATQRAQELGFHALGFNTLPVGTTSGNAELINNQLRTEISKVDAFVLVGASKGVHELTYLFLNFIPKWSDAERAKLHAIVSMSGVIRSSYLGTWVSSAPGIQMELLKSVSRLKTHEDQQMSGMMSTTVDAWTNVKASQVPQMHSNFVWVNFSMLPAGEDGQIVDSADLATFSRYALEYLKDRGPTDGLVETAGTVLPPQAHLRQWVVRGWGSHIPTYGKLIDGTDFANTGRRSDEEIISSGEQTADSLLRSLPANPEEVNADGR